MLHGASAVRSWFAAALAVLVLLSGDGLHALAHGHGEAGPQSEASGQLEVHAGDCQHRPDVPAHHGAPCLLCKHVGGKQSLASPEGSVRAATPVAAAPATTPAHVARPVLVPGVLGARAPPLLSA